MDALPHVFQSILANTPGVPRQHARSLNDDDIYLVNMSTQTILQEYGASSATAAAARVGGIPLLVGQGLLTGMQARRLGYAS